MRTKMYNNSMYSLNVPEPAPLTEEEIHTLREDEIPSNPDELSPFELAEMDDFLTNEENYFEWLIDSEASG